MIEWITVLSLEDLERITLDAQENMDPHDKWNESMPEALPCLAAPTCEYNGGSYLIGWQFLEMYVAVRLTGFARLCGFCMFGHVVTNAETGARLCTRCDRPRPTDGL